jgi:hypothetical protein
LSRGFDSLAQVSEQREETFLLVGLCRVVGSPFLFVGLLDRDRFGERFGLRFFVESEFALDHVFDCKDVCSEAGDTQSLDNCNAVALCPA